MKLMSAKDLEMTNEYGDTALSLAAISGVTKLAKLIVDKNRELVTRTDQSANGHIPVIVASLYGHKEMVHYLYDVTPIGELNGKDGATLLNCLITADMYGKCMHVSCCLKSCPLMMFRLLVLRLAFSYHRRGFTSTRTEPTIGSHKRSLWRLHPRNIG